MEVKKITISLPSDLVDQIRPRRDEFSGAVRVSLERYLECMRRERAVLRDVLSDGEIGAILDTLNGTGFFDQSSVAFLPHEIADAIKLDGMDTKWSIDGKALTTKLAGMDYASLMTLIDAAERFWAAVGRGENPDHKDALR